MRPIANDTMTTVPNDDRIIAMGGKVFVICFSILPVLFFVKGTRDDVVFALKVIYFSVVVIACSVVVVVVVVRFVGVVVVKVVGVVVVKVVGVVVVILEGVGWFVVVVIDGSAVKKIKYKAR